MALVKSVRLNIITDPGTSKEKLDAITLKAEKLAKLSPEIKVKVDDAAAALKLQVLKHELKNTGTESETLGGKFRNLGRSMDQALPGFTNILAAGLALGPGLLPVLAAVTGVMIGLGAAAIADGAAFGIFGIAAKFHLTEMEKQLKKVQAANLAANKALATPAGKRTATQKQQIADAKQMTDAFNKDYGVLAKAQEQLHKAWEKFTSTPIVNSALANGMKLLTGILPHLVPLLRLGGLAFNVITSSLQGFIAGGGLDKLVHGLVAVGRPAIIGFVNILHNLAVAFGALSGGAAKFSGGVVSGLVRLSQVFATWAVNKGPGMLTGLMNTIRRLGPGVGQLLLNLARILPNLAKGLFPLAPLSLALSNALASIIANVPPGVITALAVAFLAVYGAIKLITAATKIWEGVQAVMNVLLDANPIGVIVIALAALATGLVLAYQHSETFRKIVQAALHAVEAAARSVWNWLKANWPLLLAILTGPIGAAVIVIIRHWHQISDATKSVWNAISSFFSGWWSRVVSAAKNQVNGLLSWISGRWHDFLSATQNVWGRITSFFGQFWSGVKSGFRTAVNVLANVWGSLERIFRKPVSFLINTVYDNGIARLWNDVMSKVGGPQLPVIKGFAAGGRITAGTTGTADDVLVRVSRGETIVPAHLTPSVAPVLAGKVPGFAKGGIVGGIGGLLGLTGDALKMAAAALTGNRKAFTNALTHAERPVFGGGGASASLLKMMVNIPVTMISKIISGLWSKISALGGGWGSQDAIAKYALSFAGKVPYVWGGTTPRGWDCSGFTSWVYKHFGYNSIPRTSEAQASWSKRSRPQAGALAFFNSPAGGPSPGHVGIVTGAGHMVSALGRQWGTIVSPTAGALYYGIPPHGFRAPGGSTQAVGPAQQYAKSILGNYGWGQAQFGPLKSLWNRESGWRWNATNPTSGAYGIPQALPASKMASAGSDWRTNADTQVRWGEGYIKGRYGSPAGAWKHENQFGWYDKGGYLPRGLSLALNTTGHPEPVGAAIKPTVTIQLAGSGHGTLDRALLQWIQNSVRVQGGGDVQVAFGAG